MRSKFFIIAFTVAAVEGAMASEPTLEGIGATLAATEACAGRFTYEVLMPSRSEPVSYEVAFESFAPEARNDSLAPCDYLIDWSLATPTGRTGGFSAYFSGEHYRYREGRLQEYHYSEDPIPFAPRGTADSGVQSQSQFADLIPQFLGKHFINMASDDSYIYRLSADTLTDGRRSTVVRGVRRLNGYDCLEYVYVLDYDTKMPRRISFENNPGQISEQSVEARYDGVEPGLRGAIDQKELLGRYPEAFELYRESTFSLKNLTGRKLPAFNAYDLGRERRHHAANTPLDRPTVVAFLESGVGSTPQVIASVRDAVASLPMQVDIVWAFLDKRADDVIEIMGREDMSGETTLVSCGGFARDCGVGNTTPVLLFCAPDSKVVDLAIGFNKNLGSLVIEKAALSATASAGK